MNNQPTNEHPNIKASREQRLSREEMIRRYEQYIADPYLQQLQKDELALREHGRLILHLPSGEPVMNGKTLQRLKQIDNARNSYISVEYADILRSGKK